MKNKSLFFIFFLVFLLVIGKSVYKIYGRERTNAKHPFLLGQEYLEKKGFSKARSFFQKAKEKVPLLADYCDFYIAKSYLEDKDLNEAEKSFTQFLSNHSESTLTKKAQLKLGETYIEQGKLKAAFAIYFILSKVYSQDAHLWLKMGEIHEKNKEMEKAVYTYRMAKMKDPLSQEAREADHRLLQLAEKITLPQPLFSAKEYFDYALFFYDKNMYRQAKTLLRDFILNHSASKYKIDALIYLGLSEFKLREYKEALKHLSLVQKKYPAKERALVLYWLARSQERSGYDLAAAKNYKKLIRNFSKSEFLQKAFWHLARYYEENGETTKALDFYRRLSKYKKNNLADDALWQMGRIYWLNKKFKNALRAFSRLAHEFPHSDYADEGLFWSAKTAQKINSEYNSYLEKLINKFPYSFYAYRARMKLKKENQFPQKIGDEFNFDSENVHFQKALLFVDLELYDEAKTEIEKFLEENPSAEDQIHPLLIEIYNGQGNFYAAVKEAEKSMQKGIALSEELLERLYPKAYWELIQKNASFYGLDPFFVAAIIREESRFDAHALSPSSAYGLMQIIPPTAEAVAKKIGLKDFYAEQLYNPRINLKIGSFYITNLLERFWGNKTVALSAYNGGPLNAKRWIKKAKNKDIDEFIEGITYPETRNYVKSVLASYWNYKLIYERQFAEKF